MKENFSIINSKYAIIQLIVMLFLNGCNTIPSGSSMEKNYDAEKLLFRWRIEMYTNSPTFQLVDSEHNYLPLNDSWEIRNKTVLFLFIPSTSCNSCFSNLFEYVIKQSQHHNTEPIIICDPSNFRQTVFLFPDHKVLSWEQLDNLELLEDGIFSSPFLLTRKSNKLQGVIILEKNRFDLIDLYLNFWLTDT
jgi:hypothetical protein